jgi:hypothetical protein
MKKIPKILAENSSPREEKPPEAKEPPAKQLNMFEV